MSNSIKIDCPNCHTKYNIFPDKLPKQSKIKLNCKKCGSSFKFVIPEEEKGKVHGKISTTNDLADGAAEEKTMIGNVFSEDAETGTNSFLKDSEITLTYKVSDKEIKKIINGRNTVIGRTEGDVIINDPLISRKHASIEVKSSTMVELKDLASTNGTFHNGMKITSIYLQSGDIIKIGSTAIHFSSKIKFI